MTRHPLPLLPLGAPVLLCAAALACGDATSSSPSVETAAEPARPARPQPDPPEQSAFVYTCEDGLEMVARPRTERDDIVVTLPGRTLTLPHVRSASGARYGDRSSTFWSRGDGAILELDGGRPRNCTLHPARSRAESARDRGAALLAVGQEPGWSLEVQPERLVFVGDYGATVVHTPRPEPTRADGVTSWQAETEAHTLQVTVDPEPCTDVMSGEPFEASVAVVLDGQRLEGCGTWFR